MPDDVSNSPPCRPGHPLPSGLLLALILSSTLHVLLLILPGERSPGRSVQPIARSAGNRLVLSLAPIKSRPARRAAPVVPRATARSPSLRAAAPSAPARPAAVEAIAAPSHMDDAAAPQPAQAPAPRSAEILLAAKREAALVAYELNHAEETRPAFRSTVQDDLDRHFAAAREAGQGWLKAARITELTRASDGATRIYRITTPLGSFCMTYQGGSGKPTYSNCPR